nr:transposase [Elizabethkingia sp. ASV34]
MYNLLSKDIIEMVVPYLPPPKRGRKTEVPLSEIVNCILYKLKTGIRWHLLLISHLFNDKTLHYKTIFGYYRKWCKENV